MIKVNGDWKNISSETRPAHYTQKVNIRHGVRKGRVEKLKRTEECDVKGRKKQKEEDSENSDAKQRE